jgi:hypothetical protein
MANTWISRTHGSAPTSAYKYTVSLWIKRSQLSSRSHFVRVINPSATSYYMFFEFQADDKLHFYDNNANGGLDRVTNNVLRDVNGFYHLMAVVDTTQATASDRVKLYINGDEPSYASTTHTNGQNTAVVGNENGKTFYIGADGSVPTRYFSGSISHFHFCDGYAYSPSDFGSTDSTTREWKINTAPNVNYGNNGFFVLKDGNSVTDQSPNTNNFTVASGTLTKTEDNPSNVFATWNPLQWTYDSGGNPPNTSFGNGNTSVLTSASSGDSADVWGTLGADSGKYYYEVKMTNNPSDSGNTSMAVGWGNVETGERITYYGSNGYQYYASGSATYGATYTQNDIIGVAVDLTNGTIEFYKNGTSQGSITNRITTNTGYWQPLTWDGSGSLTASWNANFGGGFFGTTAVSSNSGNGYSATGNLGIFQYQPSTGYTALCTKGLNL